MWLFISWKREKSRSVAAFHSNLMYFKQHVVVLTREQQTGQNPLCQVVPRLRRWSIGVWKCLLCPFIFAPHTNIPCPPCPPPPPLWPPPSNWTYCAICSWICVSSTHTHSLRMFSYFITPCALTCFWTSSGRPGNKAEHSWLTWNSLLKNNILKTILWCLILCNKNKLRYGSEKLPMTTGPQRTCTAI